LAAIKKEKSFVRRVLNKQDEGLFRESTGSKVPSDLLQLKSGHSENNFNLVYAFIHYFQLYQLLFKEKLSMYNTFANLGGTVTLKDDNENGK